MLRRKQRLQSKVERKQVKWNGDMITVLYVLVSADLLHCETTSKQVIDVPHCIVLLC